MEKSAIVASLGERQLLRPAWIRAALAANDRLKLYLTLIQSAVAHAAQPDAPPADLRRECAAAGLSDPWLTDLPRFATMDAGSDGGAESGRDAGQVHVPGLPRLAACIRDDLRLMLRPVSDRTDLADRCAQWGDWLDRLDDGLSVDRIRALGSGDRKGGDSVHLLVMDMHKAINQLAAKLADETIDGAHVWQVKPRDRERIAAFMRGLNRTRALKLDHPGLETAATRDGATLLLQNDIGTNDAHVLVVKVEKRTIWLTYSDLHRPRFRFFQKLLGELGVQWTETETRTTAGLNADEAYQIGTARFDCPGDAALDQALEGIGARIVFLIDWNRARKMLQLFVDKRAAIAILTAAARQEVGHMGWLAAGGDALIHAAMQAQGDDFFQIGDRLDDILGERQAADFLGELLTMTSLAIRRHQPLALIADESRLLLARHIRRRRDEFDLLCEHASYCHLLAERLRNAMLYGHYRDADAALALSERAKRWERSADLQVEQSRRRAERHARWLPFTRLIEHADDIADGLEEAIFLLSLIAAHHHRDWSEEMEQTLQHLVDIVFDAVQDHVRALWVASTLSDRSDADDQDMFVDLCWRVLSAERQCDAVLRDCRRLLSAMDLGAAAYGVTLDFASALEGVTDVLLAVEYELKDLVFSKVATA